MLCDTHCHLDFPQFDSDRDEVLKRAREAKIDLIVNAGSTLKSCIDSVALAKKYDFVFPCLGIHPHDADGFDSAQEKAIDSLLEGNKIVAIGEIGLDYFKNYSAKAAQVKMFEIFLKKAKDRSLPVIIHCREAQEDFLKIINKYMPINAVVHCFSGDAAFLKSCLDLGFYVSFTCNITYKKAQNLRDLAKPTPLERLMLETDAPYLSPEGLRGKRNEPANVKMVAEEIARIKSIDFEEVARVTTQNAKAFFKIL